MKGEINMSVFRGRGFKAHQEEQQRREKEKEKRKGRVWRFFLQDGEEDVPIRFLTEEPILFYEHTIKTPDGKEWEISQWVKQSEKGEFSEKREARS